MSMQRAMTCVAWAVITTAMAWAATSAEGADKKETAAELALRGTLVRKSGTAVFVQTDGELQPRRFELKAPGTVLDPKFAAYVKDLAIGTLVELSYGRDSAGRRSANILVLAAPGAFGQMTGVVTDKSDKTDAIEVRDEQGKTERFCPHWRIGGDYKPPGGFDREMLKAIVDLSIGDRVEVHWTKDDHIRVSTMRFVELSPRALEKLGVDAGTVVGQVAEKGKDWVVIKDGQGDSQRYVPQRILGANGQLDYDILRTIAGLKVGDAVEGRWFRDAERRLYVLKGTE